MVDRWLASDHRYFKVRVGDGRQFVLLHDEVHHAWELAALVGSAVGAHRTGKTLVANPGALFRANPKTCIVLDVVTGELKPIIISTRSTESSHARPGIGGPGDSSHAAPPIL